MAARSPLLRHPSSSLSAVATASLLQPPSAAASASLLQPPSTAQPRFFHALLLKSGLDSDASASLPLFFSSISRRRPSSAISLFLRMHSLGLPPDPFILPTVLTAASDATKPSVRIGRQVHSLAAVSGFLSDAFMQSSLVHMYVRCSEMRDACKVFEEMPVRNVVGWSAVIVGYAQRGFVEKAMRLFWKMREEGVEPNLVTWNGMVAGFGGSGYKKECMSLLKRMHVEGYCPDRITMSSVLPAIGDLEAIGPGMQAHGYALKCGFVEDECMVSALIDMYGKCRLTEEMVQVFDEIGGIDVGSCNALITGLSRNGLVDDALESFRKFEGQGVELNVISWTSIISSCVQNGKDMEALELFRQMHVSGISPNLVTVPSLLPACANVAALVHGKSVHCYSLRKDLTDDVYVGSAIMDMYAKCGRLGDARIVFNAMPSRNVVSWNTMVGGYAMHGKGKDAIELFLLMQSSEHKPDHITFSCILSACSQSGLTEEGVNYFDIMQKDYGIVPRMEHYACIVSLLGRAGKLEEAYAMIENMKFVPDACVWGALLSSCRVHGNVNIGEIAAGQLFRLEPTNVGNYVLLSNIYASKGMKSDVNRMRGMMKSLGLKKNPGCSWIEVKNKRHVLLAGDKSHPQMDEIFDRLGTLGMEMKKLGYLPSTDLVLQDVEEQEKEHILCGHSEKLAVVVGLLNTSPGTPLRVIKNLRICGDCHNAIKFISSFEKREIFVRDTNRFHHFKDGACSCGDYW